MRRLAPPSTWDAGGRTRLQSPDFAEAKDRYELDIAGGAGDLVVEESA